MEKHSIRTRLLLGLLAAGTLLSATAAFAQPTQRDAGNYGDIFDYLPDGAQQDAWLDTTYDLKNNFNDICGDTFCEGEYPNLESLSFRCSVDNATGIVGECMWLLAASHESINNSDGKVIPEPVAWQCIMPLAPMTYAMDLAQTLANRQPLWTTLPQTDKTLYDGLYDCLLLSNPMKSARRVSLNKP